MRPPRRPEAAGRDEEAAARLERLLADHPWHGGAALRLAQIRLASRAVRPPFLRCVEGPFDMHLDGVGIGQVSNSLHARLTLGKAGRSRWLGRRPHNRGVVMNPVDHPMGGGEGRSSGGRHPCTPWGVPTKGKKTRKNKATDQYIVRRRK